MKLDRLSPTDFALHLEAEELAALITAVRCALEPGCTEVNESIHQRMTRFVAEYDVQATKVSTPFSGARPATLRLEPPLEESYGTMYDPM